MVYNGSFIYQIHTDVVVDVPQWQRGIIIGPTLAGRKSLSPGIKDKTSFVTANLSGFLALFGICLVSGTYGSNELRFPKITNQPSNHCIIQIDDGYITQPSTTQQYYSVITSNASEHYTLQMQYIGGFQKILSRCPDQYLRKYQLTLKRTWKSHKSCFIQNPKRYYEASR